MLRVNTDLDRRGRQEGGQQRFMRAGAFQGGNGHEVGGLRGSVSEIGTARRRTGVEGSCRQVGRSLRGDGCAVRSLQQ
jgi:hypothetical protein